MTSAKIVLATEEEAKIAAQINSDHLYRMRANRWRPSETSRFPVTLEVDEDVIAALQRVQEEIAAGKSITVDSTSAQLLTTALASFFGVSQNDIAGETLRNGIAV